MLVGGKHVFFSLLFRFVGFFPRLFSSVDLGTPSESLERGMDRTSSIHSSNAIGFRLRGYRTLRRAPKERDTVYKGNYQAPLSAFTAAKAQQLKPSSSSVRLEQSDYILPTYSPSPEGFLDLKGPQNVNRFPSALSIAEKHDTTALHPSLLDLPGLEGVHVVSDTVSAAASMEKIMQLGDDVW